MRSCEVVQLNGIHHPAYVPTLVHEDIRLSSFLPLKQHIQIPQSLSHTQPNWQTCSKGVLILIASTRLFSFCLLLLYPFVVCWNSTFHPADQCKYQRIQMRMVFFTFISHCTSRFPMSFKEETQRRSKSTRKKRTSPAECCGQMMHILSLFFLFFSSLKNFSSSSTDTTAQHWGERDC